MPSPFPGMDPFIETSSWPNFHNRFISALSDTLVPILRPRYVVQSEQRIYVEHEMDDNSARAIIPDIIIGDTLPQPPRFRGGSAATLVAVEPVSITLPMPEQFKQRYLTIRDRESFEIVTIIELLSPANKRASGGDRLAYLSRRDEVLWSDAHLIELDLLRGGRRLPTIEPLPLADYFAIISRRDDRPRAVAYPWNLRQPLPTIPIPLAEGDPDVQVDLQAVFSTVYDRLGYADYLNYSRRVEPVLSPEDEEWVAEVLKMRASKTL